MSVFLNSFDAPPLFSVVKGHQKLRHSAGDVALPKTIVGLASDLQKNRSLDKVKTGEWQSIEILPGIRYLDYPLSERKKLKNIQKILFDAHENPIQVFSQINRYPFDQDSAEGQLALIEICKLAAARKYSGVSQKIEDYGIKRDTKEGQKALIEIAKIVASKNAAAVSKYIQNYGINPTSKEGQKGLIEIAKIAAKKNGVGVSQFIQRYRIDASSPEGQEGLAEIAKIAAQNNNFGLSQYILNYGMHDFPNGPQLLIEIAKLAAISNCFDLSKHIQLYGIKNFPDGQRFLIEIAKIAASSDGWSLSTYIKNFDIDISSEEGQKTMIEIAKIAAQENGAGVSRYIDNYGIDDSTEQGREGLIAIAKSAAQEGDNISKYIPNYRMREFKNGKQHLIEIAKMAARKDHTLSEYIQNYGLDVTGEDLGTVIEIAKIAAEEKSFYLIEFIQSYGIDASSEEGQKGLIEIAKIAALKSPEQLISKIDSFEIQEPEEKLNILLLAFQSVMMRKTQVKKKIGNLHSFNFPQCEPYTGIQQLIESFSEASFEQGGLLLECFLKKRWEDLSLAKELFFIRSLKEEHQQTALNWLAVVSLHFSVSFLDKSDMENIQQSRFFLRTLSLHSPWMRYSLADAFVQHVLNSKESLQLFCFLWKKYKNKHSVIFITFFMSFTKKLDLLEDWNAKINLFRSVSGNRKQNLFVDAHKLHKLLRVLDLLRKESRLDAEDKELLISCLLTPMERAGNGEENLCALLMKSLRGILGICNLGAIENLKREKIIEGLNNNKQFPDIIQELFYMSFRSTFCIHKKWDDLDEKMEKTFGNERVFHSLMLYLSTLNKLPETERMTCCSLLGDYLEKVMEGSFSSWRYQEDTHHLKSLFSLQPGLKERWMENTKLHVNELKVHTIDQNKENNWTVEFSDDPFDLLLCGTEIEGSCLKVDGVPELTKCLLAYLVDGKNKIIVLKQGEKIKARAILRLLIHREKQMPVLFLEKIYPARAEESFVEAVIEMAQLQAKRLKLPLLNAEIEEGESYSATLESLDSRAPFEYVDAQRAVTRGAFTITKSYLMPSHQKKGDRFKQIDEE